MDFVTYQFESSAQFYAGNPPYELTCHVVLSYASSRKSTLCISRWRQYLTHHSYAFPLPSLRWVELSDLLEEGGFHDNPESQVNTFISLIVRYQGTEAKRERNGKKAVDGLPGVFLGLQLYF